jgi:hypothetical protein
MGDYIISLISEFNFYRLRVYENGILGKVFGPKREEVTKKLLKTV